MSQSCTSSTRICLAALLRLRRLPILLVLLVLVWFAPACSKSTAPKTTSASSSFWNNWMARLLRAGSSNNDTDSAPAILSSQSSSAIEAETINLSSNGSRTVDDESNMSSNWPLPYPNSSTTLAPPPRQDDSENDYEGDAIRILSSGSRRRQQQRKRETTMSNKRLQFLDRIAVISSSLIRKEEDLLMQTSRISSSSGSTSSSSTGASRTSSDLDDITPQSDLSRPGRHMHVVTTAALPWFTGTAVNPLLRAAYLHRKTQDINRPSNSSFSPPQRWVTFVIPWLEWAEDQQSLYGRVFNNCSEQEDYIRNWLRNDADMADAACPETGLQIVFYPARYHAGLGSIFAMGDIMEMVIGATTSTNNNSSSTNNETAFINTDSDLADAMDDSTNDEGTSSSSSLDVCFLEEPEHCNWYRAPGDGWTKRFNFVVGIVHTNYKEYANAHYSGLWTAPAIALMSSAMVRAYCHKVIKLSNTLQSYAVEKESTSNVHGVRANFWQEGVRQSQLASPSWATAATATSNDTGVDESNNATQIYFIGKLLWAKGLDLMLELEDYYKQYTGDYFPIDIYGSGPDQMAITRAFHAYRNSRRDNADGLDNTGKADVWNNDTAANGTDTSTEATAKPADATRTSKSKIFNMTQFKESINPADIQAKIKESINAADLPMTFAELVRRQPIPATFPGRVDHGSLAGQYKIFVNPSISEVLCTTTAEALASGRYAIIPVHPSNTFFLQFPNCLAYRNKFEFVANLRWALTHDPEPLTADQSRQFTWEAATERLLAASAITWREALMRERLGLAKLDERIAWFHNEIGKGTSGDFLRRVLGAGPASHQVKYQKDKEAIAQDGEPDSEGDSEASFEDEDEIGFGSKFRLSWFARTIRAAMGDFSAFGIQ